MPSVDTSPKVSRILNRRFLFVRFSSASQLSGIEAEEDTCNERVATYKVGMLGASGVGKTALTAQFTTSDYICAYDTSLGEYTRFSAIVYQIYPRLLVSYCEERLNARVLTAMVGDSVHFVSRPECTAMSRW